MGMLDLFRKWLNKVDNRVRARRYRGFERSEQLEIRRLLTATLNGTVLTVVANPGPLNNIQITQTASTVSVNENGSIQNFSTPVDTINVNGFAGDDLVTVTSLLETTAFTFNGGSGNNSLISPNGPNVWIVTGLNSGTWNGHAFSNVQNLIGGVTTDQFRIAPGGIVSGVIDGGSGGANTLDYSALTNGVIVNLASKSGTAIGGGFQNITGFVGSADNKDLLIGSNTNTSWRINGANQGSINTNQVYSGFENINGGSGNDSFAFVAGGIQSGNIGGGLGTNTLDYSSLSSAVSTNLQFGSSTAIGGTFSQIGRLIGSSTANDTITGANYDTNWRIDGPNSGSIQYPSLSMSFVSYENLVGGTSYDTFRFAPGGFISGVLNGGMGQNTLDYSLLTNGIVVNLQNNSSTAIGGGFQNLRSLVGTANTDTLIGADAATTWNITSGNTGNINGTLYFKSFENLAGGTAADVFKVSGGFVSGTVRGGTGAANTLDYSSGFGSSVVNLQKLTATGIGGGWGQILNLLGNSSADSRNYDTLIGTDTNNTWNITLPNAGNLNNGYNFSSFENLTGGSAVDVFRLAPDAVLSGTVNGGPIPNGGDWLDYSQFTTTPVVVNLATGAATNFGRATNIQNVHGGDGGNTLSGNVQGNVLVGGISNDTVIAGTGKSLLIGGAGRDSVHGNSNEDIVISSYTIYDANLAALSSILAEWQSQNSFDQRVDNLRRGGGLNKSNVLIADITVLNDAVPDVISGGGSRNWLWGQPAEIQNATPQDLINTPINNPPILAGNARLVYTVGQGGVPVDSGITVTDGDSTTLVSATVKITSNYVAGQDGLGFIPSINTGNIIGSFNSSTGVLTLTSAFATATVEQFQTALRSVTYSNSSSNPSTQPRTISFQAFDGLAYGNVLSTPVTFNFAPTLSGNSAITYTAGDGQRVLNPNVVVNDQNSLTLSYATVSFNPLSSNFFPAEDFLSFAGNADTGDIVGSFNRTTGTLTLSSAGKPATIAQFQAALRLVTYTNISPNPTTFPRTLAFQVNDGYAFSNRVTTVVTVLL